MPCLYRPLCNGLPVARSGGSRPSPLPVSPVLIPFLLPAAEGVGPARCLCPLFSSPSCCPQRRESAQPAACVPCSHPLPVARSGGSRPSPLPVSPVLIPFLLPVAEGVGPARCLCPLFSSPSCCPQRRESARPAACVPCSHPLPVARSGGSRPSPLPVSPVLIPFLLPAAEGVGPARCPCPLFSSPSCCPQRRESAQPAACVPCSHPLPVARSGGSRPSPLPVSPVLIPFLLPAAEGVGPARCLCPLFSSPSCCPQRRESAQPATCVPCSHPLPVARSGGSRPSPLPVSPVLIPFLLPAAEGVGPARCLCPLFSSPSCCPQRRESAQPAACVPCSHPLPVVRSGGSRPSPLPVSPVLIPFLLPAAEGVGAQPAACVPCSHPLPVARSGGSRPSPLPVSPVLIPFLLSAAEGVGPARCLCPLFSSPSCCPQRRESAQPAACVPCSHPLPVARSGGSRPSPLPVSPVLIPFLLPAAEGVGPARCLCPLFSSPSCCPQRRESAQPAACVPCSHPLPVARSGGSRPSPLPVSPVLIPFLLPAAEGVGPARCLCPLFSSPSCCPQRRESAQPAACVPCSHPLPVARSGGSRPSPLPVSPVLIPFLLSTAEGVGPARYLCPLFSSPSCCPQRRESAQPAACVPCSHPLPVARSGGSRPSPLPVSPVLIPFLLPAAEGVGPARCLCPLFSSPSCCPQRRESAQPAARVPCSHPLPVARSGGSRGPARCLCPLFSSPSCCPQRRESARPAACVPCSPPLPVARSGGSRPSPLPVTPVLIPFLLPAAEGVGPARCPCPLFSSPSCCPQRRESAQPAARVPCSHPLPVARSGGSRPSPLPVSAVLIPFLLPAVEGVGPARCLCPLFSSPSCCPQRRESAQPAACVPCSHPLPVVRSGGSRPSPLPVSPVLIPFLLPAAEGVGPARCLCPLFSSPSCCPQRRESAQPAACVPCSHPLPVARSGGSRPSPLPVSPVLIPFLLPAAEGVGPARCLCPLFSSPSCCPQRRESAQPAACVPCSHPLPVARSGGSRPSPLPVSSRLLRLRVRAERRLSGHPLPERSQLPRLPPRIHLLVSSTSTSSWF